MYFLCSTVVIIRKSFKIKEDLAMKRKEEGAKETKEERAERIERKKREFNTIAKLSIIMGKV